MNRRSVLFILSLFPIAVFAQIGILPHDSIIDLPAQRQHRISAEGWADYNSSTVYNEMPWNIYWGGYIDHDLRQRSREQLKDRNSAGYDVGMRLSWLGADSLFGKQRLRPIVSLAYHNLLGVSFARDVYELAFFGNAHYEDRTAYLSPSAHTQISWQSAGFGVQDARSRSFLRIDLLRGRSFNSSDLRQAELYTAPDGRHFQVAMDAEYLRTDTAGRDEEHTNGIGASISGRWNLRTSIAGKQAEISLRLEDAGFMQWNPNSVRIERDTGFVYEGLNVENIFDLGDVLIGEEQLIDTFGLRYEYGSFTTIMPFRASVSLELALDEKWKARLMVDHRYLPGYVPQVMLNASRRIGERVLLGASAAYGGFGVMRFGIASRIRFGDLILLELGSTHVPGFFMGTTRGAGAYVSLSVGF